jgi:ABC-type glycerol-3-phosphate transport system substrate-binding protein
MKTLQKAFVVGLFFLLLLSTSAFAKGGIDSTAPKELVKIQFFNDWAPEGAQGKVLQKLADEFNAENQGKIEVTLIYTGGKRNEKIAAALAAGVPPDIAWISGSGEKYYDAEQLLDMSRVYDGDIIDRKDVLPGLLENMAYIGEDITIPFENSSLAVYYNKKMLDEKGIPYPSAKQGKYTWDQFIADAKAFSDPEKGKYGWDPRLNTAVLNAMFWEAGGEYFSEDFKTNILAKDPKMQAAMIKALNRFHEMVWVEKITSNDVGDQGFNNGDMPFEITGPWSMPRYLKPQGNFNPGEIGIAPMPADDDTGVSISRWYQKALALFRTTPEKEWGALQFIKWFYSAPIHARWCVEAGYLPVTKSALKDSTWKAHEKANPWVMVFIDQVPTMRRNPSGIPSGGVSKMRDTVRYNEGTPEEALKVYQKDAQDILDEFWSMR